LPIRYQSVHSIRRVKDRRGIDVFTELILPWLIGLGMTLVCGYPIYRALKEIKEDYRKQKAEKKLLWWYLELPINILDLFGTPGRPGFIFFLIGSLLFVVYTIKIVGRLFGYHLLE
jgi:hypothetical protein